MTWQDDAACRGADPAMFFIERGQDARPARAVCAGCTVRAECLDYAIANGERYGVWGGLSEAARKRIRSARRRSQRRGAA